MHRSPLVRRIAQPFLMIGILAAVGCSSDDPDSRCTLDDPTSCAAELICQAVVGSDPMCFAPVEIRGNVSDALDVAAIDGATVVGLDADGGARTSSARTDAAGNYSLMLSVQRNADGSPVAEDLTLRVEASGYQTFPTAPRVALPLDLSAASLDGDGPWVLENAATSVALLPLADTSHQRVTINGRVDADVNDGVLVVAVQGDHAVATTITDADGSFLLFNVPLGTTRIEGYRAGIVVTPENLDLTSAGLSDVTLMGSSEGLATVQGSVNIVDAPGGSTTSVVLVVESTFDATLARGSVPAGLRATNVSGAFSIEGVAPGRYVALAAFDNDGLVRDPDQTIAGTDIVHVEVTGTDVSLDSSFKVTGALAVVSPGAEGLELIDNATPTLSWADDSSEDGYDLRIYDAFGTLLLERTDLPKVTGGEAVQFVWSDAQLQAGMIYQFRAMSWREQTGTRTYISATEDLRGVFQYQPATTP